MAEVKWIKLTTGMFEDEKVDFIESLPESDSILIIWLKLLTLAGKCNMKGHIFLTENIPYTDEMLAHKFRRPINTVRLALQTLQRLNMIEVDENSIICISNWEKHQNIDGMEKIKEQTKKRVAEHRERKKQALLQSNVTVTHGNETDLDKELEKEKAVVKEYLSSPFAFYEQNGFGTISPFVAQDMGYWIDGTFFQEPELIIIEALKEGVLNNVRNWKYVNAILLGWNQKGYKTVDDVQAGQKEFEARKQAPKQEPKKPYQNDALAKIKEMEQNANREF